MNSHVLLPNQAPTPPATLPPAPPAPHTTAHLNNDGHCMTCTSVAWDLVMPTQAPDTHTSSPQPRKPTPRTATLTLPGSYSHSHPHQQQPERWTRPPPVAPPTPKHTQAHLPTHPGWKMGEEEAGCAGWGRLVAAGGGVTQATPPPRPSPPTTALPRQGPRPFGWPCSTRRRPRRMWLPPLGITSLYTFPHHEHAPSIAAQLTELQRTGNRSNMSTDNI